MRHACSIAALAAAVVILVGCQRKPAAPPEAPRPFILNDAMQHWYGRYDPATQTARVNLPDEPSVDLTGSWFSPRDPVDIIAIFDAGYTEQGRPQHVVVTAAVPHRSDKPGRPGDDLFRCILCRPVIGMAVFARLNNVWTLEQHNDALDLAGGNGLPPGVKLVNLGPDVHGIRLESHTEAIDFASARLSLLVPWRNDIVRAFSQPIFYTNGDACGPDSPMRDPCFSWQRLDTLIPVSGQPFDDLVLTGSGTEPPPDLDKPHPAAAMHSAVHGKRQPPAVEVPAAIPFRALERLRFKDGKYVPIPGTSTEIPPIFAY